MTTSQRLIDLKILVDNKLTGNSAKIAKIYRLQMMGSIVDYLDRVRLRSIDFIVPSKYPNIRNPYILSKMQKPVPGKLTERTGALIKMLKDKTTWRDPLSTRVRQMDGDAIQGTVKVTTQGVVVSEEYSGELRANIRTDSKYWPFNRGKAVGRPDKQQLFMRFRWETGIRGEKRPFMEPAGQAEQLNTERIIQMKLDHLEMII
jgi:hypothetical protein